MPQKSRIEHLINSCIASLQKEISPQELHAGELVFNNGECQILAQSPVLFELIVDSQSHDKALRCNLVIEDNEIIKPHIKGHDSQWNRYTYACLLQVKTELNLLNFKLNPEHKQYSREGMIQRVLAERREKAEKADYKIKWASNIYGDHILTNEKGVKYKIFLRDFENETGYSDSWDSKLNKLGTTKHIMYAFQKLKSDKNLYNRLSKEFPFIEIYCDPLNDYKISWYYKGYLTADEHKLVKEYFGKSNYIEDSEIQNFLYFIEEAQNNPLFRIRPEVNEKIERAFEEAVLEELKDLQSLDFKEIKANLYPYQKEGVEFTVFKKAAIIADEMGLGKTLQAIAAAVFKKEIFDFKKTLVICPASLKVQWQKEIERFTDEKALIIQGKPEERAEQYYDTEHFFMIVNYETVLRDAREMNKAGFDFLILDEAQRVKNYETKTASAVKRLQVKHTLVITGTPIENRLIDIYSIVNILDPYFFGPLWEFSYQHCLFDPTKHNKINGYYDLQKLNSKLDKILIRREKRKILDQLPKLQQHTVYVPLSPLQDEYHGSYTRGIAKIISKKFLTPFDLQRLQMLLAKMRMVCDSTYLVDEETNESPKLEALEYMLLEELDIRNTERKIVIFSEWVKVHKLIGRMLRENNIGFVELTGKIPVKYRGELISKFENNKHYKIFLSSAAGGTGLNLQVADTVINFELPWNPAIKNQRIGRIDRIGQKSENLTVVNFVTRDSIEQKIEAGLLIKQNLFEGVLTNESRTNFVDFSRKGRSQFIQQLEEFVAESEKPKKEYVQEELFPAEEPEPVPEKPETPEQKTEPIKQVEDKEKQPAVEKAEAAASSGSPAEVKSEELETVMNNGMEFLSGLFKMATGKAVGFENQKIEVDKSTGEVTMKFKLPV